jgi:hypothetical protein
MNHVLAFSLVACAAAFVSCGGSSDAELRRYREISIEPPSRAERMADVAAMARAQPDAMPAGTASDRNAPAAPIAVRWTTPDGWVEKPGNPMRIMTFLVGPERAECTLTAFPGAVGGIEGNLARWAGQLNLNVAQDVLARFARAPATFETEGGFACLVYDFADVAPDSDPSILAAILPLDDQTLFVKLTGPRALLADQREAFKALCRSLRP